MHHQGDSQRETSKLTGYSRCGIQALFPENDRIRGGQGQERTGRPGKCPNLRSFSDFFLWGTGGSLATS